MFWKFCKELVIDSDVDDDEDDDDDDDVDVDDRLVRSLQFAIRHKNWTQCVFFVSGPYLLNRGSTHFTYFYCSFPVLLVMGPIVTLLSLSTE